MDNKRYIYHQLYAHRKHKIEIVLYGRETDPEAIALACKTCNEILFVQDKVPNLSYHVERFDGEWTTENVLRGYEKELAMVDLLKHWRQEPETPWRLSLYEYWWDDEAESHVYRLKHIEAGYPLGDDRVYRS